MRHKPSIKRTWREFATKRPAVMERQKIRVILLEDVNPAAEALSENESTTTADFFSCVGLWENRDISLQSIRAKA